VPADLIPATEARSQEIRDVHAGFHILVLPNEIHRVVQAFGRVGKDAEVLSKLDALRERATSLGVIATAQLTENALKRNIKLVFWASSNAADRLSVQGRLERPG